MNIQAFEEKSHTTMVAADVMSELILVANADWSVSQLAEFFVENSISGAPVVSMEKGLIGAVTHTDIVRHCTQTLDEQDQTHDYYLGLLRSKVSAQDLLGMHLDSSDDTQVTDIMTSTVFRVEENTPIAEIAETMTRGRIHRLFVTRDDEVVGVVAALDLVRLLCEPV
jgi:predicted transcriptional regulator